MDVKILRNLVMLTVDYQRSKRRKCFEKRNNLSVRNPKYLTKPEKLRFKLAKLIYISRDHEASNS